MLYRGYPRRTEKGGFIVFKNLLSKVTELSPEPSQELRSHSPDGFAWGYGGSGPAQLALALLLDFTGDQELALDLYQYFKEQVIAFFPMTLEWSLEGAVIQHWLDGEKAQKDAVKNHA